MLIAIAIAVASCNGEQEAGGEPDDATGPGASSLDVEQPKPGGTLRVAVVKDHSTFDPQVVVAIPDCCGPPAD